MESYKHFIPVKITSADHATELMENGAVFMRALHEFGTWGIFDSKEELKNNYRGDLYSGVCEVFSSPDECPLFRGLPEEQKRHMVNCCMIDYGIAQYFKVFSMVCLDYDNDNFQPLDKRMEQFGDTAVVFNDFSGFLGRLGMKLLDEYGSISILCDRIEFFDFSRTREMNPLFYKYKSQAYQNELRIAVCQLEKDITPLRALKKDYTSIKPEIGSIHEFASIVPVTELTGDTVDINPDKIKWPSSSLPGKPSVYDNVVEFTKKQMKLVKCENKKVMFGMC